MLLIIITSLLATSAAVAGQGNGKRLGNLKKTDAGKANARGPDGEGFKEKGAGDPFSKPDNASSKGGGPVNAVKALNKSMAKGNPSNRSIQARNRNIQRLLMKIQDKKAQVEDETKGNSDKTKQFKNQNVVRERVMALLALNDETQDKGIGRQISEVAKGFKNSINRTQKAEEKIQERGGISRLFFGGDHDAADEIEDEVGQNRGRISTLKQLRKSTGEDVGAFIDEQLKELEVEQNRLKGLAEREKQSKGIFGWLFK